MAKIWQTDKKYNIARVYARIATRASFRKVDIKGLENIPEDAMVILAPNHCAALMDPMMILQLQKNEIVFGARSDIFKQPFIAKILKFLRIVPIARERNGSSEVAKNLEVFDMIVDVLDNDAWFCLYAEGTHNAERGLLPIKKGIFRIAKMAQERTGKKMCVVPVAVDYEYFFTQTGRVKMRFMEPIDIGRFFEERKDIQAEAKTYRELCEWLSSQLLSNLGEDWNARERNMGKAAKILRIIPAVLLLPLFIACAIVSAPIWLTSKLILRGMEDKAWTHTVNFVIRLLLPVLWPFEWVYGIIRNFYATILGGCCRPR